MTPVRVQDAAAVRIDEIYRYTRERWGEAQADAYIRGLFEAFEGIATGAGRLAAGRGGVRSGRLRFPIREAFRVLENVGGWNHRHCHRAA